jgi:hypothetical protein
MILHVLPGDAIVEKFEASGLDGEVGVCREALVDGDLSGGTLPEFWETRARSLGSDDAGYHEKVVREFNKLTALQSGSEINLWFEYELFCQTNMWFCLDLIGNTTADVYRVAPVTLSEDKVWDGFANLDVDDLRRCFDSRVKLTAHDLELGSNLWSAYKSGDMSELEQLSHSKSPAFPMLREVCVAAIERESRPKAIVTEIVDAGKSEFGDVFREFKARAGVYGYGDTQVKKIWQDLVGV